MRREGHRCHFHGSQIGRGPRCVLCQCRLLRLPFLHRGEWALRDCIDNETFGQVVLEALASGLVS